MYQQVKKLKDIGFTITNLDNKKTVTVKVNDRGSFSGNHIIKLSHKASEVLGITSSGLTRVAITEVGYTPIQVTDVGTGTGTGTNPF